MKKIGLVNVFFAVVLLLMGCTSDDYDKEDSYSDAVETAVTEEEPQLNK